MRTATVLFTLFAAATLSLTACGGGGDDDGAGDDDSAGAPDANNTEAPDAAPDNESSGLGQVCTPQMACPAGAPECAAFEKNATQGMCTLSCGTGEPASGGGMPTPPATGDATCAAGYTGTGTPACVVYGEEVDGMVPWSCGVLCGTSGTTNLGECPTGLTCTSNFCMP
jgi:hypothetical protein